MKTLLLIQPAQLGGDGKPLRMRRGLFPFLNLPHLAGLTPNDYDITIWDEYIHGIDFDRRFDVVGITAQTNQVERAYQIAAEYARRDVPTILGGPHASHYPDDAEGKADAIVVGEAELVWRDILADAERGALTPRYTSPGFIDLAEAPTPRYDLIDIKRYGHPVIMPVQTTRGCIYSCDYCTVPTFFENTVRYRPVADVVRDVRAAGAKWLVFVDDNITMNADYAEELFEALIPLKIRWFSQANIGLARNHKLVRLAERSGCVFLYCGVESLNQRTLNEHAKGFNRVDEYAECIRIFRKHGIEIMMSMMVGFDEDSATCFRDILEFLNRNNVLMLYSYIYTPTPGTRRFDELHAAGRITPYTMTDIDGTHAIFRPTGMTQEELVRGYWNLYEEFYAVPAMLRRTLRTLSWKRRHGLVFSFVLNLLSRQLVKQRLSPLTGDPGLVHVPFLTPPPSVRTTALEPRAQSA